MILPHSKAIQWPVGNQVRIIAIDPGSSGAICFLDADTADIKCMLTSDNPLDIADALFEFEPDVVIIEEVHSLYGMSAGSNFKFGFNVGLMHGLLRTCGISQVKTVQPKEWQKSIGITTKGKEIKKEVERICLEHYPDAPIRGPRGGFHDGKSDALGIAIHVLIERKKYEN